MTTLLDQVRPLSLHHNTLAMDNNNNLTFIMRLKHAMQTQRRRTLHIGKTHDQHLEACCRGIDVIMSDNTRTYSSIINSELYNNHSYLDLAILRFHWRWSLFTSCSASYKTSAESLCSNSQSYLSRSASFTLQTNTHSHIHAHIHTHTHTHTCIHAHIHPYIHAHIHAHIHTYTHTYIHAYTHAHIQSVHQLTVIPLTLSIIHHINKHTCTHRRTHRRTHTHT